MPGVGYWTRFNFGRFHLHCVRLCRVIGRIPPRKASSKGVHAVLAGQVLVGDVGGAVHAKAAGSVRGGTGLHYRDRMAPARHLSSLRLQGVYCFPSPPLRCTRRQYNTGYIPVTPVVTNIIIVYRDLGIVPWIERTLFT